MAVLFSILCMGCKAFWADGGFADLTFVLGLFTLTSREGLRYMSTLSAASEFMRLTLAGTVQNKLTWVSTSSTSRYSAWGSPR